MWRPGFAVAESQPAWLEGQHRAFCRYSFRHRGSPGQPGLVMGLMPGGNCLGMALRTTEALANQALEYLDAREGKGYRRVRLPLKPVAQPGPGNPEDPITAWVYLPNPDHESYFGSLPRTRLVELLANGNGESGSSLDYLRQLLENMSGLG